MRSTAESAGSVNDAPFTVTAARRRPVRFPTLDTAWAHVRKLQERNVAAIITDSAGREVGSTEFAGRAS